MRDTGSASPTEPVGRARLIPTGLRAGQWCMPGRVGLSARIVLVQCFLVFSLDVVLALDLFTLWQRPELPLNLEAGQWADYRRQALVDGRRTEDLLRIQCLGQDDRGNWVLEVIPLEEAAPGIFVNIDGEGLVLRLSPSVTERRGGILQVVEEVRLWRDGSVRELGRQEWRHDPLVTASFSGDFQPDSVKELSPTLHVIKGRELTCRRLVFAAADTQAAALPQGHMIQVVAQEVTAAVNDEIPLLGLAYVTEHIHAESWLEPPSQRRLPPPQERVEILECVDYGSGAVPLLSSADESR